MPRSSVLPDVLRYNAGRDPVRLARKLELMRRTPFAFFRGAAHRFYGYRTLLAPTADTPAIWSTGDLHLENFGCYEGDNRLAYFDLNDFDEAALGPLGWDLIRLLTSLELGLRAAGHRGKLIRPLCELLLGEYAEVLAGGKPRWIERSTAEGPIRRLLRQAARRTRRTLLEERCRWNGDHTRRKLRVIEGHANRARKSDRERIARTIAQVHLPGLDRRYFRVLDSAERIAGTASLGLPRFIVLIEGEGTPDGEVLLDVKGAIPSSLAAASPCRQPRWLSDGERIVTVQGWVQAVSPALLTEARLGRGSCVVRELQPTADRLRLAGFGDARRPLETLLTSLARIVAWGHLRAAGREGAAGIDALIRFGALRGWRRAVRSAAEAAAEQVESDWRRFRADLAAAHDGPSPRKPVR